MLVIFVTNVIGVRKASKFNDSLTIAKVTPLLLLMCFGSVFLALQPQMIVSRFQPFLGGDLQNVGQVLVIVFWAYAGFELSTLPADEIQDPKKTIPRALIVGMLIAALIYMATNFVVPLLRKRGLFRSEYEGETLREHYGLARPGVRF